MGCYYVQVRSENFVCKCRTTNITSRYTGIQTRNNSGYEASYKEEKVRSRANEEYLLLGESRWISLSQKMYGGGIMHFEKKL